MLTILKKYLDRRYSGPSLTIPKVSPDDMGAYLCIAENMVPPAQSKRVFVYVQCEHLNKALTSFRSHRTINLYSQLLRR